MKDLVSCPICKGKGKLPKPAHLLNENSVMKRVVAKELYNHGFSLRQIGRFMKINASSVRFYIKGKH